MLYWCFTALATILHGWMPNGAFWYPSQIISYVIWSDSQAEKKKNRLIISFVAFSWNKMAHFPLWSKEEFINNDSQKEHKTDTIPQTTVTEIDQEQWTVW